MTTKLVEISQGIHSLSPRQVLGQPAVPHLGEAPQLFEHAEGMLTAGAGPRTGPVDEAPALTQRLATGAPVDAIAHAAGRKRPPVGLLPVRLIAKNLPLLPVLTLRP